MYGERNDIDAFLAQINFEKACKCFKAFNFGENFIHWI